MLIQLTQLSDVYSSRYDPPKFSPKVSTTKGYSKCPEKILSFFLYLKFASIHLGWMWICWLQAVSDSIPLGSRDCWIFFPFLCFLTLTFSMILTSLPIFHKFLFFETLWCLEEKPLTRMLVQHAWCSDGYFLRYSSSKIELKFSLTLNFIPKDKILLIFDIFILTSFDRDGCR